MSIFQDGIIRQGFQYMIRDTFSVHDIDHLHLTAVNGITEQQQIKLRRLRVGIHPSGEQVNIRKSFEIQFQRFHCHHILKPTRTVSRQSPTRHCVVISYGS